MYFPSFLFRLKSSASHSNKGFQTDASCVSSKSELSTGGLSEGRIYQSSSPTSSEGPATPFTFSRSDVRSFQLDLPHFPSLLDDLPQSWQVLKVETTKPVVEVGSVPDRRDDLIEELLDQITQLRQKVRILGEDNSRLRRALMEKRSQELRANDPTHSLSPPTTPGATAYKPKFIRQDSGSLVDEDSRLGRDSDYSCYHNSDYLPNRILSRPRTRTQSLVAGDKILYWGNHQRRRFYSLPTPPSFVEYSTTRLDDRGQLDLSPRLRRLINSKCASPQVREAFKNALIPTAPPVNVVVPPPRPQSSWGLNQLEKPTRKPQSRVQLSVLEPIFRCFACSQKSGHCAYADGIPLVDRYITFGYFDMIYYNPTLGLWGPANDSADYSRALPDSNEQILYSPSIEAELRHLIEVELGEVDVSSNEEAPSSPIRLLNEVRRENLELYFSSHDPNVGDAQRRRERHIALLDSIIEEEELEEIPLDDDPAPEPTVQLHHPKPLFASKLTQSTLSTIPELDDSTESATVREPLSATVP